jgi:two-component system, cell cycle response regulator DivK
VTEVLLVEDNEMNWDVLSRRLNRKGYEVVVATDGQQGLDLARSEAPDLVLMDMSLPVIDGWEATRQLRAAPERSASMPPEPPPRVGMRRERGCRRSSRL